VNAFAGAGKGEAEMTGPGVRTAATVRSLVRPPAVVPGAMRFAGESKARGSPSESMSGAGASRSGDEQRSNHSPSRQF
jgi:hypothetical protein